MLVSLFIFIASGTNLFFSLQDKSTKEVPLRKVKTPLKPDAPVTEIQEDQAEKAAPVADSSDPIVDKKEETKAVEMKPAQKKAPEKRNILFSLYSSRAKKVSVIGDFNNWYEDPLKKDGKLWKKAIKLKPGKYKYLFKVDGRRIKDPNNAKVSKDGKSLIVVKSITASK